MLHPRELIGRYGQPRLTTRVMPAGVNRVCQPSYDRWFLAFWSQVGGTMQLRPVSTDGQTHQLFNFTAGTGFFAHQLTHGLLVNCGFETDATFLGGTISVMECFAMSSERQTIVSVPAMPFDLERLRKAYKPRVAEVSRNRKRRKG